MKNQMTFKQRLKRRISGRMLIVISILYSFILPVYCLLLLDSLPPNMDNSLLIELLYIYSVGSGFFIGPFLFLAGALAYFLQMLDISMIPPNSSLYDAIMSPTIQEGPVKIILPVLDEEMLLEEIESKKI